MERRRVIAASASILATGVAGCLGGTESEADPDTNTSENTTDETTTTSSDTEANVDVEAGKETIQAFFEALNDGDVEAAEGLLAESADPRIVPSEDELEGVEFTVVSIELLEEKENATTFEVQWEVDGDTGNRPTEGTTIFELIREDGEARIQDTEAVGARNGVRSPMLKVEFDYDSEMQNIELIHDGGDHIMPDQTGLLRITGDVTPHMDGSGWTSKVDVSAGESASEGSVIEPITAGDVIWASEGTEAAGALTSGDEISLVWESSGGDTTETLGTYTIP